MQNAVETKNRYYLVNGLGDIFEAHPTKTEKNPITYTKD